MAFSQKQIDDAWNKAIVIEGFDKNIWRQDLAKAFINRQDYGKDSLYGWSIDHVYPLAKGGDNTEINLRPMQFANNMSKSDSFPSYTTSISSSENKNIQKEQSFTVYRELFDKLKALYRFNINYPQ